MHLYMLFVICLEIFRMDERVEFSTVWISWRKKEEEENDEEEEEKQATHS